MAVRRRPRWPTGGRPSRPSGVGLGGRPEAASVGRPEAASVGRPEAASVGRPIQSPTSPLSALRFGKAAGLHHHAAPAPAADDGGVNLIGKCPEARERSKHGLPCSTEHRLRGPQRPDCALDHVFDYRQFRSLKQRLPAKAKHRLHFGHA